MAPEAAAAFPCLPGMGVQEELVGAGLAWMGVGLASPLVPDQTVGAYVAAEGVEEGEQAGAAPEQLTEVHSAGKAWVVEELAQEKASGETAGRLAVAAENLGYHLGPD